LSASILVARHAAPEGTAGITAWPPSIAPKLILPSRYWQLQTDRSADGDYHL